MIRLVASNPRFSGERAGVRFRNGEAEVGSLTGLQRAAMRRLGIRVIEPEPGDAPNALGELTVRELRELADSRGVQLPKYARKAEIIAVLS